MIFIILSIALLAFMGCSSNKTIQTVMVEDYVVDGASEQSIDGMTIKIEPLGMSNAYEHPELFGVDLTQLPDEFRRYAKEYYPETYSDGRTKVFTLGGLDPTKVFTAFTVSVTNNTDHILRMGDARIYLRLPEEDPLAAITSLGSTAWSKDGEGNVFINDHIAGLRNAASRSIIYYLTQQEYDSFEEYKSKHFVVLSYPIGLVSQVIAQNIRNYKLINDLEKEILPGDTYKGILFFRAYNGFDTGNLKFYDIITQTDAAGNPTKKTTFDFQLKSKITKMWYNSEVKKWIEGEPPAVPTQPQS
jgi:hypothetical protein